MTATKTEVLKILEDNRARHRRVFEDAIKGYREEAIRELDERIQALKNGKLPSLRIGLIAPQDHTRDYDRVIRMIKMDHGDTWVMTETEFAQYIEDDWDWKRQWLISNSGYAAATVKAEYGELPG